MDIASIGGIALAIIGILAGMMIEGGNIAQITQPTAAMIVFGGTLGAVMLQFPLSIFLAALKAIFKVFLHKSSSGEAVLAQIVGFANKARRSGIVSLDADLASISDPFLRTSNSNPSPDNKAPVITGGAAQSVTLPAAATLKVTATDDGLPKPGPGDRGGKVEGLQVRWILYRGPGKAQFDPDLSPAVYGKPLTSETKVSFSSPGNYKIRAIATDGAMFSTYDVDVKVNPSAGGEKAH